ncbi:MAG: type II secretion system F family protein [Peptococcaceae bacterium]|nr:type II secretion system F family protein [Peptococcaceae bacterium]
MTLFLAIAAGLTTGLALWALLRGLYRRRYAVILRLKEYSTENRNPKAERTPRDKGPSSLRRALSKLAPRNLSRRYTATLQQAGVMLKGEEMVVGIGLCALIGALLGALTWSYLGLVLGALLGSQVPSQLLQSHLRRRLRSTEGQLFEMLTLSANALRAGNSLFQALDLAGREMPDPLGAELKRTLREIGLGLTVEEALQGLVARVPSPDLDLVVTAILIQRQVGGDLAGILDSIASTIRQRQQQKVKLRTLTAQGRLSGMVIAGLPFLLLLALQFMNPDYISLLWTEPLGLAMLLMGLVSQIIGMVLINKIIKVEM